MSDAEKEVLKAAKEFHAAQNFADVAASLNTAAKNVVRMATDNWLSVATEQVLREDLRDLAFAANRAERSAADLVREAYLVADAAHLRMQDAKTRCDDERAMVTR